MRKYIFLSSLSVASAGLCFAPPLGAQEPPAEAPRAQPGAPAPSDAAPDAPAPSAGTAAAPAPTPPVEAEVEAEEELEFEGTAEVEAPPREVTKRSVDAEVVQQMPGTRGDALRAIEIMPGVARTSIGQGEPILRGAAAGESQVYLDGIPVPFMFHFGGLTSFMSSRLVKKLDVYPGNFSARYGRAVGGVIDITSRDPSSERFRAVLDLSLIDSSAFVESPITEKLSVAAAVRRSNIDFVFKNFVPKDTYSVVAAPTYFDYQAMVNYRFNSATRLRLMGYGSRDSLQLFFKDANDDDPGLAGSLRGEIEFHRIGVDLRNQGTDGVSGFINVTAGRIGLLQHIGQAKQRFDATELYGRAEASFELHRMLRLTAGGDFFGWFLAGKYHGPQPGGLEGDPTDGDPLAAQRSITVRDDNVVIPQPAAYLELGFRPVPELLIAPGVRVDYYGELQDSSVDPRIAARYELTPTTALKGGVGYYSQPPQSWQSIPGVGNPDLKHFRAMQTSAGVEQKLGDSGKLSVEGFYKRVDDIVIGTENREAPQFVNAGEGRIFGAELAGQKRWKNGFAYLAYTLSRSERRREGAENWRLFDQDQTHVLALAVSQGLGRGWTIGARFRLVSGNPSTPIAGATYDVRTGVYLPTYGATNSRRDPLFNQLDARVEKEWQIGSGKIAAYLDVQNVYAAKNPEGYRYSFDYSKREAVSGLSLFPNLGVRGEL
ncbi:MAG: TonB family protein / TonB-dependent receptor [Polyangiaceae bacterium]|nr:TonB family protein / TonB-dependent receptor [Polyangiaceae bacterium]